MRGHTETGEPGDHTARGCAAGSESLVFQILCTRRSRWSFHARALDSSLEEGRWTRRQGSEPRPFPLLVPGDFINLNRTNRSGHAVVFLGFLNASGEIERRYDASKVVGFKYFSAQGAGLGYRWAYFAGNCPGRRDPARPRDCGVLLRDDQRLLHTGYMLHPSRWTTAEAKQELESRYVERRTELLLEQQLRRRPTPRDRARLSVSERRRLESAARRELTQPLPGPITGIEFDGVTTDDPPRRAPPPRPGGSLTAPPGRSRSP
jgi:hypothetical protein